MVLLDKRPVGESMMKPDPIISESYREFRNPMKIYHDSMYEKVARRAGRILKIGSRNETTTQRQSTNSNLHSTSKTKKMVQTIDFAHLNITARDVASLTIIVLLLSFIPLIAMLVGRMTGVMIQPLMALSFFFTGLAMAYYVYSAPYRMKKRYEMTVGADMISAVLYMVISMRNNPSLEAAMEFAARNTGTSMSLELRKLLWDVRVGNYLNVEDAILDYAEKWKSNREFGEAINLLVSSTEQSGSKFTSILDEAVRLILRGNRETSQLYISELRLPLIAVNAMGLILPIMGLVMFPVVAIFLEVGVEPLLVLYDVLLPVMLLFLITSILEKRPVTFSKIDITHHPNLPPPGKFRIGKRNVSAAGVALLLGIILAVLAVITYSFGVECITPETGERFCQESESLGLFIIGNKASVSYSIMSALLFTLAMTIPIGIYFFLISKGRSKLREDVRSIESEFREALFQLGNKLRSGAPIEKALIESIKRMEDLKIRDLFIRAAYNMQRFSMTFERAFFDKQQGALIYYPSTLVESVMKAVAEAAKKGPKNAGNAMLSISNYLKDLHDTQNYVERSMSTVTNSIKFQAYVLTPLISGVIGTMAVVIIRILSDLQLQQETISSFGSLPISPFGAFGALSITPFQFIVVVSIFVAQSLFLYGYLLSGIQVGEDPIKRAQILASMFTISTIIYCFVTVMSMMVFGPLTQLNL